MSANSDNPISNASRLVECAAMIAVAVVLSILKILDLPYGGSVTVASMLPIIIISYRHGIKWGLLTGFVFGITQQLLGLNTLSYVTTWQSVLAVILLDYIVAYTVTGLGGVFKKRLAQPQALLCGAVFVCVLRYICHVISGATVWAGLSIPTNAALLYSFGYNATYMIPETIVTGAMGYFIGSVIDFEKNPIGPMKKAETNSFSVPGLIAGLLIVVAMIVDAVAVFSNLQNPESGEFDITGLSAVNWTVVAAVTVAALVIAIVMHMIAKKDTQKVR